MINSNSQRFTYDKLSITKPSSKDLSIKNNNSQCNKVYGDSTANTKSTKSTCSTYSSQPTTIVKMFDSNADFVHISPGNDMVIFECEEALSFKQKEEMADLNCEEIIQINNILHSTCKSNSKNFIRNESIMEIETELTSELEIKIFEQNLIQNEVYVDIFHNMVENEQDYSPDPFYFKLKQRELNSLMRSILADWMMEVSSEFFLKRETFHIAINYVDRYLSAVPNVLKWDLQLIGLTSMFIASKMEVSFIFF